MAKSKTKGAKRGPLSQAELTGLAARASKITGVPIPLILSVIKAESGGNPRAGSSAGAQGLMQLMPGTAAGLGVKDVWDPWQNVLGGTKYLDQQLDTFDGNVKLALSAYNSGPGGSESSGRIENFPETQAYVQRVMQYEREFQDVDGGAMPAQGTPIAGVETGSNPAQAGPVSAAAMGGPGFGSLALQYEKPIQVSAGGPMSNRVAGDMLAAAPQQRPGIVPLTPQAAIEQSGAMVPQAMGPGPVPGASTDGAGPAMPETHPGHTDDETAAAHETGLNQQFMRRFLQLQSAVREAGGDLTIFSGARDAQKQDQLYQDALRKYGSESEARKWVAPPGKSNHDPTRGTILGIGAGALAADLRGDLALAHKLAPQFGLSFPLANEAWHIEYAGIRDMKR